MADPFELEGFEPISKVGSGGFGDVWLARQTNVDRQVAVKVGHAPIQDEMIRLRFDRECKALGRLSGHPNIVDVYTAGTLNDGRPYLVLEYVDSGTLWQRLKQGQLHDEELARIGSQLAGALHQAHSQGVLHRDLKPENILMRSNGDAVLGDFGIARLQDGAKTTSAAITASVAYAAPEILSGKRATTASDLYGVGVCLLAAIIRTVPFVAKGDDSIHPIIKRVLNDDPPDIRQAGVSDELALVVGDLLAKQPEERPVDAATVMARFDAIRAGRINPAPKTDPAPAPAPAPTPTPTLTEEPAPAPGRALPDVPSSLAVSVDSPDPDAPARPPSEFDDEAGHFDDPPASDLSAAGPSGHDQGWAASVADPTQTSFDPGPAPYGSTPAPSAFDGADHFDPGHPRSFDPDDRGSVSGEFAPADPYGDPADLGPDPGGAYGDEFGHWSGTDAEHLIGSEPTSPTRALQLFALAYGATLLVGGLLLFVILGLF